MKVQPMASPHAQQPSQPSAPAQDARQRAINMLTAQPQANANHPAQLNQNAIGAEDLGAIQAPSQSQSDVVDETPAVTEEVVKPAEDPALSRQFAQLARQERQLRAQAQKQAADFKAREEALKAREAELATKGQQYSQGYIQKDMLRQDLVGVLTDAGIPYEEAVQQLVGHTPQDPRLTNQIRRLEAQIKAMEEQTQNAQKNAQEQQTKAYQAALLQIKTDATTLVKNDPSFEAIRSTNSVKDVVDLIEQTFNKDGILLTVEEAAQQVEDYLTEEAWKLSQLGKIKKRMATQGSATPKAPSPQQTPGAKTPAQPQPMKTLTNATSSSRQLSAKERAILAFKGELGKG